MLAINISDNYSLTRFLHSGRTIRCVTGSLTLFRQDAFQPVTRLRVLIAEIVNDVAATIDRNSSRHQVFLDHFHERLTFHVFCVVSLSPPPLLG